MRTLKGDLITEKDVQNAFFSSYEGKYNIIDNIESSPFIQARKELYNADYVFVIVVLRGTLHLIVGGTKFWITTRDTCKCCNI